jgi:hypothetical protein
MKHNLESQFSMEKLFMLARVEELRLLFIILIEYVGCFGLLARK